MPRKPPAPATLPDGWRRAVVESICPQVDHGRFAVKRIVGDHVAVEADCFADGHDVLSCRLRFRREEEATWQETPMAALGNDRWRGAFTATDLGRYRYAVSAWVDPFLTWRHDLSRRIDPDDIRVAARLGSELIAATAARARGDDRGRLTEVARRLREGHEIEELRGIALDKELSALAQLYPDRSLETTYPIEFPLVVDPARAGFSSWYELFPRSTGASGTHGTFRDCEARLPYVAAMGFDVLYLPPIHPIGRVRRKGRNNVLAAGESDVGSPWAIGAAEGGHKSLHPLLGTMEDFRSFRERARACGLELALDLALQCAPDHPYVDAHPEWFKHRPDGSIQYAENPPKKYQDIYPFDFETEHWQALWEELYGIVTFWLGEGVRIFRVDNPHTKPFAFWEWALARVKDDHPDAIFLAEAFTRPRVMHRLAKLGFTQSYTYFTWRNTKQELTEYFTELNEAPGCDYFRPNCWPNTPDILPESLQVGGRPAFLARLVLAATLSGNYGIYGPAFELMKHTPREPGAEEYANSEKFELRHWDLTHADSLAPFIARVNAIRREHSALSRGSLAFMAIDNDELLCHARIDGDGDNVILVVVNLDPHHTQAGWVTLDLEALGIDPARSFQVHDLLTDAYYIWNGPRNFVELDPARVPAHILHVRKRVRSEHDFDYFL